VAETQLRADGLLLKPSGFARQTLCAQGARGYDFSPWTDTSNPSLIRSVMPGPTARPGDLFMPLLPKYIAHQMRSLKAVDEALELFKLLSFGRG
jgi:hypothetical protein